MGTVIFMCVLYGEAHERSSTTALGLILLLTHEINIIEEPDKDNRTDGYFTDGEYELPFWIKKL